MAKRDVLPGSFYKSKLATGPVNNTMLDGKKGISQEVVYGTFGIVSEEIGKDPFEMLEQVMENVMPTLEVKVRCVGGVIYQVPMGVRPERRQTLGLCWITRYPRLRSEKTMKGRFVGGVPDTISGAGGTAKKHGGTHKVAEANRAFVHYGQ